MEKENIDKQQIWDDYVLFNSQHSQDVTKRFHVLVARLICNSSTGIDSVELVVNDTAVKCHFYIGAAKIISLDAIVGMAGLVPYYDTKSHQLESYFTRMWNALFEIKKEYF